MNGYPELFAPLGVKGNKLPNRIVIPPMVQVRSIVSPEGIAWYQRLADSGAGLIIVEATGIPRFGRDLTVETLKPLVDTLTSKGAVTAIQLFPINFGETVATGDLTTEQIEAMINQFAVAADICRQAGFAGVEPHGAHGYLLNQFFMPNRNHRKDQYGGSFENRCRPALEIVEKIRHTVGEDMLILYRHTPAGDTYSLEDSLKLAQALVAAGVDMLDISPAKSVKVADMAQPFKAQCAVPVIAVNGMEDPRQATAALREGRCDLVAVGRQLIADAQWPAKVRENRLDEIVDCAKCDIGCFGNLFDGQPVECVQWAEDEICPAK